MSGDPTLELDGAAAIPRSNGEPQFSAPWQSRTFGMAMTLHEQGQLRAAFGVQEQTALLNLADTQGVRLVIGVAQDGNPSVSFLSENGQLSDAGLSAQRWLYPFPDYKLPVAILTDDAYRWPDAVDLVDQLVGPPIDRIRMGGTVGIDQRAVHRQVVAAGLGPDMANSFLVVAGADQGAADGACVGGPGTEPVLAWRFTGDDVDKELTQKLLAELPGILV